MDEALFKAILSLDSYNRGYDGAIQLETRDRSGDCLQIGNATIFDTKGDEAAQNIGFYGIAYDYDGSTIISYRRTDDVNRLSDIPNSLDNQYGWGLGFGNYRVSQALMALEFFDQVTGDVADTRLTDVSFTGHSRGSRLA